MTTAPAGIGATDQVIAGWFATRGARVQWVYDWQDALIGVLNILLALILLAGVATGAATVFVGPLSFVGLMAPHLARRLGLARPEHHVTGAALIGAGLMLAADFGARMAGFPYELPLGLFASLIGAPWLIWLMMRRR